MSEEADVLKLLYFDEAYLGTVRLRLRSARTGRASAFALGEQLEAYFWLALGVEIGYYGESTAELLAANRFIELLSGSAELFRAYGFLFAPDFEVRLRTAQNQRQILQKAVDHTFVHPAQFHRWFHRALSLEIESLQDERLTTFFAILAFLSPPEVEALLAVEQGTVNKEFFGTLNRGRLLDTFSTSISHLESFAVLDNDVGNSSDVDPEDSLIFRARLRQLTRWRLNFRIPTVARYYPIIAAQFFDARLDGLGLSLDAFRDSLGILLDEWGLTHASSVTA